MTDGQLSQYDLFLDENDWDIYYWATQEPQLKSEDTVKITDARTSDSDFQSKIQDSSSLVDQISDSKNQSGSKLETDKWRNGKPRSGEWAQTVGTVKPAYRPVPARWKNSEILAMLRRHVISRSAGGIHDAEGKNPSGGGGMMFFSFPLESH